MSAERTKNLLAELPSLFYDIIQNAPDGIVVIDENGVIKFCNRRIVDLLGYSRNELLEPSLDLLLPEELRELHHQHRRKYFGSPHTRPMGAQLDTYGLRRDGSKVLLDISISYVEQRAGVLGVAYIRERKQ